MIILFYLRCFFLPFKFSVQIRCVCVLQTLGLYACVRGEGQSRKPPLRTKATNVRTVIELVTVSVNPLSSVAHSYMDTTSAILYHSSYRTCNHGFTDVITSSARILYGLRTLPAHGMPQTSLQLIFRTAALAKLLYAAPAFSGDLQVPVI